MHLMAEAMLRNGSALFLQGLDEDDLHARDILDLPYPVDIV